MEKLNKFLLPTTIIISTIILCSFLYLIEIKKNNFEERQAWGRCVNNDWANGENLLCKSLYPAGYKAWSDNYYK